MGNLSRALPRAVLVPGEDRFTPFTALVAPKANETRTLTLRAGVYRYFCTLHAKYVAATDQVAALSTAGFPDQPMQGVLIVG